MGVFQLTLKLETCHAYYYSGARITSQVFNKEKAQQRRKEVQVCLPTSRALRLSAVRNLSIRPMISYSRGLPTPC